MGYNARNDEIRDNVARMRQQWEEQRGALETVRRFNATLSAKGYVCDPEASIRVALREVVCPRRNGHGRPRIIALAQHASI